MGPHDTDIRPRGVKETGDDLEAESRHARERLRHSLDGSDTVQRNHAHGDWSSATEVKDCATAWENHMIDLIREMSSLGEKLRTSAQGYEGDDHYVGGLFRGMQDLGRA